MSDQIALLRPVNPSQSQFANNYSKLTSPFYLSNTELSVSNKRLYSTKTGPLTTNNPTLGPRYTVMPNINPITNLPFTEKEKRAFILSSLEPVSP